ncbi:MAG: endonuclease/exonuclease/phosphatase family protein [Bacteroidota bacterium]|nr:endonuclease/exonuclease/phosphatase family protein [Bacteroidota bacterium]
MNALRLVWIFSVVSSLLACSKGEEGGTQTGGVAVDTTSELRVLSYNIHHANPPSRPNEIDMTAIANVIKQQQPHLVALQEVDVYTSRSGSGLHQAEELGKLTGMKVYFAKAIDYGGGAYGVALLSKFPISNTNAHPLPLAEGSTAERRTLGTALITLGNGKKLVFATTHLDAQSDPANRQLQIAKIVDILKAEQHPVILTGDFNAVPGTPVINTLDAQFTRTCTTGCDFNIPASAPTRTIDFIAYAPAAKWTVLQHKVIDEKYASDHRPVFALIRIN